MSSEGSIAELPRRVAAEPARHNEPCWLFLLLSAVKYQRAAIYLPPKSWQSCGAEWVRTAAMLAVISCYSLLFSHIDAHLNWRSCIRYDRRLPHLMLK